MIAKKLLCTYSGFGDNKLQENRCMNLKRSFYAMLILTLLTFLAGCPANKPQVMTDYDQNKNSSYYLSQADKSSGYAKTNWQLMAIQALVKENQLAKADGLLSQISSHLDAKQQQERTLLLGEIAVKSGRSFNFNQFSTQGLTQAQLYRYYTIKLSSDEKNKEIDAQAHDYIELEKYAPENQKKQILNNTWNFFSKLNVNQINSIVVNEDDSILQGWINLSYAYTNNSKAPTTQEGDTPEVIAEKTQKQKQALKQAVADWLTQYPDHPAKNILPILTGEQTLAAADTNAKKVALLLPLNGSSRIFGDTIKQGYSDAIKFFPQEPQQNVVLLDTTSAPMDTLIQQAKEQNVELIVGPLLKDEVVKIKQLAPSIPVLALNKVDNNTISTNKMCFFALSPEDEAKDAADHIYAQSKVKPLLLVPQNDLGKRVAQTFAKQWSQLSANNSQAYVQYFGNKSSLSANMNQNSGISLSGSPILINDVTTQPVPPEQSASFDAIYIYSSYDELTLIKPMLDMGAAKSGTNLSQIMIYTSSKSHVANASNDFNYDMNKTEYADIPMIINRTDNMLEIIPSNIQKDYSLLRLYAMGIDAWRLANRFNQLDSYQPNFLDGMTGKLSTSNQCEVTRALSWQQYIHGSTQTTTTSEE